MRVVPSEMTQRWHQQAKTGDERPTVRATIQQVQLHTFDYDTAWASGGTFDWDRHRKGTFTSIIFGDDSAVREIRNIRQYQWTRSLDQDVATCELTLLNSEMIPIGSGHEDGHRHSGGEDGSHREHHEKGHYHHPFDLPGYYTFNRGEQQASQNRWDYTTETGWQKVFMPDRLVKTYEGYSHDDSKPPEEDPNLVISGTWLIDQVTYNAEGDIVLRMRDVGRLLLDQIVFPPVVPPEEYPLYWDRIHDEEVPTRDARGGDWSRQRIAGTASSSNDKYVGKGLENPPYKNYVGPDGGFQGHHARHVLENDPAEDGAGSQNQWSSTGQETKHSFVWWQVDLDNPANIAAVRIHPAHGPYRVFISLKGPDGWYGRKKIPYEVTTEGVNLQADIPFVDTAIADRTLPFDVTLPRVYPDVRAVRITLTQLWDGRVGKYPYRAGLKDIRLYTGDMASLHFEKGTRLKPVGNYWDYTNIIKWVGAWGGWYWPPQHSDMDFIKVRGPANEDNRRWFHYAHHDNVLPKGRVWGDFMKSGTYGEAKLGVELFDKQPLMDVINYVRDLLGFIFFIDETGAMVWRLPNIGLAGIDPKLGNYISPKRFGQPTGKRTSEIVTIDEDETLIGYDTTLSSEHQRERIFVANSTGKFGTVIKPEQIIHTGFRRTAGWTDQHFETKRETRVMADMIAARQMFEYRRSRVRIPGYPAIQVDDQVRIYERVTNETYYHYVIGINCTLDMDSGDYTYELDTHWLGEQPSDAWVVDVNVMENATQSYLNLLGAGGNP